jgi:hypothetical protein
MSLVERLMGLNADGSEPVGIPPDQPKISVHAFFAACSEIINGRLTVAQVKTYLDLDATASTEFDALVATAPTGTTALSKAEKGLYLDGVHSVFILSEVRATQYATATDVRGKLGI